MKTTFAILLLSTLSFGIITSSCQKQTDYSTRIDALQARIDSLAAALATTNANLQATNSNVNGLIGSVTAIQTQLSVIVGQISTLNTQLTTINSTVSGLSSSVSSIQSQITVIVGQVATLNTQMTTSNNAIGVLSISITTIQSQLSVVVNQVAILNTQQADTTASLADINTQLSASITQLNNLLLQFNALLTQLGIVIDADGNEYHSVTIGTQVWMVENLRTTKYKDGTPIPLITDNTAWSNLTTPSYSWYNNDAATYKNIYGGYYNWYTVNSNKLAPLGWHVPSTGEWTTLYNYLGGGSVAGGKLKETGFTHWYSPNTGATNESGFTAFAGGARQYDGQFNFERTYGYYWTSTEFNAINGYLAQMAYNNSVIGIANITKTHGFCIRCIKD